MNNYIGLLDEIFTNGDGIGIAPRNGGNRMKRNRQILKPRKFSSLSLGDLILAVSSCTSSNRETVATVAHLFASGRGRLQDNGRFLGVPVCWARSNSLPCRFVASAGLAEFTPLLDREPCAADRARYRMRGSQGLA